jgi:hypothetical protein
MTRAAYRHTVSIDGGAVERRVRIMFRLATVVRLQTGHATRSNAATATMGGGNLFRN